MCVGPHRGFSPMLVSPARRTLSRKEKHMRLQGKVAVVTGAASGMGRAMAIRFAAEGASVVATDWNGTRLDEVVAEIKADRGAVTGIQGNIADQATAEGVVDTAIATYGHRDVLVNNAGVMDYMQGVGELSDDVWRRVLSINLDGPMYTSRRAIPHMVARGGGSIVNVASTAALEGGAAGAAYSSSKHALVGLTKNTAWMYAQKGVRCNAICPGGLCSSARGFGAVSRRYDQDRGARGGDDAGG